MEKQKTAVVAIIGGVFIFAIKLYTYFISGSIALLSDALESIVNIVASIIMFQSVRISGMPPDEEHMYGHQKVENISALVEGGLVVTAGLFIGQAAFTRLYEPVPLVYLNYAVGLSLLATMMNGGLSWMLMRKARETNSIALEGDARHLLSDVVSSIGVAVGLLVSEYLGLPVLDPLIALVVAALVLRMGVELVWKAGVGLMDRSCPETEEKIKALLERHSNRYVDFHELKTRRSGDRVFAELHLSVDGSLSVQEAHDFTDHLEENLRDEIPEVSVTIHIEPERKRKTR
ncbi:MAG: cation diffusion facilitator family transporter [Candidatus Bathyarchaeota archaeon]|nr:cation diffusion facilitator family transporter [Candidatus Bathyarchaeota archaeon]